MKQTAPGFHSPEHPQPIQAGGVFVPHIVWKEWMPRLRDTELRVMLVVLGHTLGWKERNGSRRRRHWLSHDYLKQTTGRSGQSVSDAIDSLVCQGLLSVWSEDGSPKLSKQARQAHRGKLLFGLPDASLSAVLAGNRWLESPKNLGPATLVSRLHNPEIKQTKKLRNNNQNGEVTRIHEGWVKAGDVGVFRLNSSQEEDVAAFARREAP